jgi:uncharacterized membrane protein
MNTTIIKTLFVSAIILLVLDAIYLFTFSNFFNGIVANVQNLSIRFQMRNLISAIICYIVLITGLNYFIIFSNKSPFDAFLLGILVYAVYETTNYAIFDKWPITIVLIDTLWGGILFALTTYITNMLLH